MNIDAALKRLKVMCMRSNRGSDTLNPARVVSVNVGVPREVSWRGMVFTTSIIKDPIVGRCRIEGVNLTGDDQADRAVHGGLHKAVYAYSLEDYAWWSGELDCGVFRPGTFGENLTTEGVDVSALCIGEQWRVGTTLLEVSEPRFPCYKLGYPVEDPTFPKRFAAAMRFGAYFRIIEEGYVERGSPMSLFRTAPEQTLTIRDVGRIRLFAHDEKPKLAEIPALSPSWREWATN